MTSLTTFTLFPNLPFEIRAHIWCCTLVTTFLIKPSSSSAGVTGATETQHRLIHISAPTPPDPVFNLTGGTSRRDADLPPWTANPASCGGDSERSIEKSVNNEENHSETQDEYSIIYNNVRHSRKRIYHPALAICAESRTEAKRRFTQRFCAHGQKCGCYFDLELDYVFLRERSGYQVAPVAAWIVELKALGMLEGVRRLAVPWVVGPARSASCGSGKGESGELIALLRTLPRVTKCAFIYDKYWDQNVNRVEVVDPGVPWGLVDAPPEVATQGYGSTQRSWPSNVNIYRAIMESILEADIRAYQEEWTARRTPLELEFKEATGQKYESLWRRFDRGISSYYESPNMDFFG